MSEYSVKKRFELPPGEMQKDWLHVAQEAVEEMQKGHPEVLSLCTYGSLVTGKAREECDFDALLYVNAEAVPKELKESKFGDVAELHSGIAEQDKGMGGPLYYNFFLRPDLEEYYLSEFKTKVMQETGMSENQLQDVKTMPISEAIIDFQLQKLEDYEIQYLAWKEKNKDQLERFERGDRMLINGVSMYVPFPPGVPHFINPGINLFHMFHLDIGAGIRPYRAYLIDKLSGTGEVGNQVWSRIIAETSSREYFRMPQQDRNAIRYPRSIDQARKVYGKSV